jgi:hypothetical protein
MNPSPGIRATKPRENTEEVFLVPRAFFFEQPVLEGDLSVRTSFSAVASTRNSFTSGLVDWRAVSPASRFQPVGGLVSGQRMAVDASRIEADANKQNSTPQEDWDAARIDPAGAPRAVREYLDTLDEAAFGAASDVSPKFTSHSDPASQWTAARKGEPMERQWSERHWRTRSSAIPTTT